jgi:hypothetical protein
MGWPSPRKQLGKTSGTTTDLLVMGSPLVRVCAMLTGLIHRHS